MMMMKVMKKRRGISQEKVEERGSVRGTNSVRLQIEDRIQM